MWGLFAKKDIIKNTFVIEYSGEVYYIFYFRLLLIMKLKKEEKFMILKSNLIYLIFHPTYMKMILIYIIYSLIKNKFLKNIFLILIILMIMMIFHLCIFFIFIFLVLMLNNMEI